ncbi:hypothetical protein LQ063_08225 [Enterococcus hirae]|uniref:hypothetical protein n=1 Tax=Enterococcus hirae TaxID=1354 RepID=UPI002018E71B|nr:hypothetical protein [Enterococcus hirae]EMF0050232.1 hypothetical protein [Enterococcus hirae]UQR02739.1 hypothetical protein LQ063_08225 [Enterococcus hirae]
MTVKNKYKKFRNLELDENDLIVTKNMTKEEIKEEVSKINIIDDKLTEDLEIKYKDLIVDILLSLQAVMRDKAILLFDNYINLNDLNSYLMITHCEKSGAKVPYLFKKYYIVDFEKGKNLLDYTIEEFLELSEIIDEFHKNKSPFKNVVDFVKSRYYRFIYRNK